MCATLLSRQEECAWLLQRSLTSPWSEVASPDPRSGACCARAGLGVLVVEKEPRFRDRVRGEFTWPWGVADVRRLGIDDLLAQAGTVEISALRFYRDRRPVETAWERAKGEVPGMGFSHPQLQEAAFAWAAAQGATTQRPAKAIRVVTGATPTLTVTQDGHEVAYRARLVVAADGKASPARHWTGGESRTDPEHHRIGGVLVAGAMIDRTTSNIALTPGEGVAWFAAGAEMTRLYLATSAERLRAIGVDRSVDALVSYASACMPEGAVADARPAGPIGFFPNSDTWASCVAGDSVVLIGDAAGAVDPLGAHGTSMLFRDVRVLSELLLSTADWDAAIAEFAAKRRQAYDVIRAQDRWTCLFFGADEEAARWQAANERARVHDPTLDGFALLQTNGPDGLIADEAARRQYFGEDLP